MADFSFVARMPDPILTPRLILRAPSMADVDAIARLANNATIHKWLARLPHPYGQDDAITFVTELARSATDHAYAILTRDEHFMGIAGVQKPEDRVEVGYWLGEPYWGEGYASEAVMALSDAAEAAGCTDLLSSAQSANHASLRVLEKCGYVKTHQNTGDCGPHKGVSITYLRREANR